VPPADSLGRRAGAGAKCAGSALGSAIGGPVGDAVNLIGQTIGAGIDIITAPARAVASVVVNVVSNVASAVGSFFSGLFGRRRLAVDDCNPLSALFSDNQNGGGGDKGSNLYDWVLSENNYDTSSASTSSNGNSEWASITGGGGGGSGMWVYNTPIPGPPRRARNAVPEEFTRVVLVHVRGGWLARPRD
jgi:hypothetical protein